MRPKTLGKEFADEFGILTRLIAYVRQQINHLVANETKDRDSECGNTSLMRLELSSQLALKKGEPFHHDCG